RSLEDIDAAHHVYLRTQHRIAGAIDRHQTGEMDDRIAAFYRSRYRLRISHVTRDDLHAGRKRLLPRLEVEDADPVAGRHQPGDGRLPNKATSAGDENLAHAASLRRDAPARAAAWRAAIAPKTMAGPMVMPGPG